MSSAIRRLAVVVSHPIQYFAPLHQRLARRNDIEIKVFFTWHAGEVAVVDRGFRAQFAWDICLTEGYEFERVSNLAREPGTHHFLGLRNPTLVERVMAWHPDLVLIHGWAWLSHLQALWEFHRKGIPTLFRGDSHLLDGAASGLRWRVKRAILDRVFGWPVGFAVVGAANRAYYEAFGVLPDRLFPCPHSVDVGRFAEPSEALEREALEWRRCLDIGDETTVLLYAGKFERKKCPVQLMRAVLRLGHRDVVLVMVGGGELQGEVDALAATDPGHFRVLPFQNQSRMPVVYRLSDLFVLPSSHGETWGLAVNEALASGRPVLVSDRVGCAQDVVDASCGRVFSWADACSLESTLSDMVCDRGRLATMGRATADRAWLFDIARTEETLIEAIGKVSIS